MNISLVRMFVSTGDRSPGVPQGNLMHDRTAIALGDEVLYSSCQLCVSNLTYPNYFHNANHLNKLQNSLLNHMGS